MLHSLKSAQQLYHEFAQDHPFKYHPKELYEPIDYILNIGGKRLRPALVLMSANLFSDDITNALSAAYAVEIFHNFTLVHDDIMDEAPLRRGQPTIHTQYDTNVAILAGDVMLVYAYEYLLHAPPSVLGKVIKAFNRFAIAVCEGQQLDVNFESRDDVRISEYIKMIELKTGALIAGALEIGAYMAGASDEDAFHLSEFGRNIGIAFQLQDDILDTYGDPDKFGKKVGGDIVQNKKTFLVLKSQELADEATTEKLQNLLSSKPDNQQEKIRNVVEIFDRLNIQEHAGLEKNRFLDVAYEHLNAVKVDESRKKTIIDFARTLVHRDI